jgi:hypothetical protein
MGSRDDEVTLAWQVAPTAGQDPDWPARHFADMSEIISRATSEEPSTSRLA